jgi:hypothetical protein
VKRLAIVLVLAVSLAVGCGSSGGGTRAAGTRAGTPQLPRALAQRLAAESDAVAAALARGDACAAGRLAERLRADATASIGRVPAAFQEPLSSGVNAVAASVPACVPPAPAPAVTDEDEGDDDEHGRGNGHGNGHGKDGHGNKGGGGEGQD